MKCHSNSFAVNFSVNGNDPGTRAFVQSKWNQTVSELSGFPLITIFCE